MSGPITPHFKLETHADGVRITVRTGTIIVPADMAVDIGNAILAAAAEHDPATVLPLPEVKPKGDPVKL